MFFNICHERLGRLGSAVIRSMSKYHVQGMNLPSSALLSDCNVFVGTNQTKSPPTINMKIDVEHVLHTDVVGLIEQDTSENEGTI